MGSHFVKPVSRSRCFKPTKFYDFSFWCSFADLKNDAIRELSHQIIIFASFVHHCDFRFVRKQFFEEKIDKKIIEDKRLQSLFLCEKKKLLRICSTSRFAISEFSTRVT